MNIITAVLYERLHRYIFDNYFNLNKRSIGDKDFYWYGIYTRYESNLKGWRILLAIWLPFVKKYRRYSYYKSPLSKYELGQVGWLSRLIYKIKL